MVDMIKKLANWILIFHKSILTFDPYAMLFCCNDKIWLQQEVLSQPFAFSVVIDGFLQRKLFCGPKYGDRCEK
jgi:hypothetical protein